jgi:hypothetical protein
LKSNSEFGFEGKKFDILWDIGAEHGSKMKFKSRDLDSNEFPIEETFSKQENWNLARGFKIQIIGFKPWTFNQGRDFNFKMKFGLMDLNSIYFIKFKRRFRMDIWSNFEWSWVNWTRNNFLKIESIDF